MLRSIKSGTLFNISKKPAQEMKIQTNIKTVQSILQACKLLLPALIPSWRFFDEIAPSPRIEFSLLTNTQETPENWQEFRPRPKQLSMKAMLKRMFWNPSWNESLFLVSCAERLAMNPTEHSRDEIFKRIAAELRKHSQNVEAKPYLQFRLVFVNHENNTLHKHTAYISAPYHYIEGKHS